MKVRCFAVLLSTALSTWAEQSYTALPHEELVRGIAYGNHFQSRKEFVERGLDRNKVQLSSAWSKDGISKYVTFYRDYHVVAARVVQARQQLRDITEKDFADIPYTGLLFANLEMHARGALPIKHLNQHFTSGATRMVLQIDGVNVQPEKEGFFAAPERKTCTGQYYSYSAFAIYNFTFGGGGWNQVAWDCTERVHKFSIEFGFRLSGEQEHKQATVIVVDSEGNRFSTDVDLSVFH